MFGTKLFFLFASEGGSCHGGLEAQQRYFSYRAMLVAIVSQIFFVFVFMGYRTIIARYAAKWGIARMCLCKVKYQGEVSHHFVGALTSLKKYRAIWGYCSDSIAVSRDMGPLSTGGVTIARGFGLFRWWSPKFLEGPWFY